MYYSSPVELLGVLNMYHVRLQVNGGNILSDDRPTFQDAIARAESRLADSETPKDAICVIKRKGTDGLYLKIQKDGSRCYHWEPMKSMSSEQVQAIAKTNGLTVRHNGNSFNAIAEDGETKVLWCCVIPLTENESSGLTYFYTEQGAALFGFETRFPDDNT